ncbi:hypothetical protein C0416_03835 [bacterium]|nr:hypothetical protein [bacterium]
MTKKEFKVSGEELLKKIREIINEGNVRKIIIKTDKGEKFVELPVTIGVIGALAAPIFVIVGAIAALASKFTVEVVKVDKKAVKKAPKK